MGKRRSGVSLLELLLAVGILLIAIAPIFGLYTASLRANALAHRVTIATLTAQLRIEEFVGLTAGEVAAEDESGWFNGFYVRVAVADVYSMPALREVTVYVYESEEPGASQLVSQSNIINVMPGGFYS